LAKEKTWIVTEDKASGLIPILVWVRENAPRKKYRIAAKDLLGKLRGVKDWRQILVRKTEEDVIATIYDAFPGVHEIRKPEQLRLLE